MYVWWHIIAKALMWKYDFIKQTYIVNCEFDSNVNDKFFPPPNSAFLNLVLNF